jgi:hypothetical protein
LRPRRERSDIDRRTPNASRLVWPGRIVVDAIGHEQAAVAIRALLDAISGSCPATEAKDLLPPRLR